MTNTKHTPWEVSSTEQYAEMIAESKINGQHQQAIKQFNRAINDHCNTQSLVADILEHLEPAQVINLLCGVVGG